MKDVVQTSVLSKRWRYVWKSHPFLNFDSDLFFSEEDDSPSKRRKRYMEYDDERFFDEQRRKCTSFLDFVDKVIRFRDSSTSIQSFRVKHCRPHDDTVHCNFKKWILIAFRSNVEVLYLSIYGQYFFNQLPHKCLFNCKSLTELKLHNKNGNDPEVLDLPDSISLPRLKTLVLSGFRFKYSGTVTNNIFSSRCFPVLESLILYCCTFHKTIGIHISAPQLKHLEIINYLHSYYVNVDYGGDKYPIKLCSPTLLTFICKDRFLSRDYLIENLPAIEEAEIGLGTDEYDRDVVPDFDDIEEGRLYSQQMIKFLRVVQNVESLTLHAPFLKALSGDNAVLESTSIQFRNLKWLDLETWLSVDCMNSITYLLNISPNIESLSLDILREDRKGNSVSIDSVLDEVHWEARLSLHRLKDVEIHGALGYDEELVFLEILLKKATVLESVTLYTPEEEQSPDLSLTKKQRKKIDKKLQALPRVASSIKFTVV